MSFLRRPESISRLFYWVLDQVQHDEWDLIRVSLISTLIGRAIHENDYSDYQAIQA